MKIPVKITLTQRIIRALLTVPVILICLLTCIVIEPFIILNDIFVKRKPVSEVLSDTVEMFCDGWNAIKATFDLAKEQNSRQ